MQEGRLETRNTNGQDIRVSCRQSSGRRQQFSLLPLHGWLMFGRTRALSSFQVASCFVKTMQEGCKLLPILPWCWLRWELAGDLPAESPRQTSLAVGGKLI